MTEDEARQKWCPMHRVATGDDMRWTNRDTSDSQSRCIASDCMAWRVYRQEDQYAGDIIPALGYCGLAGKP